MVDEAKQLAKVAKEQNRNVNIVTINMSKTKQQADSLGVSKFPTIRLFKNDGSSVDFPKVPRHMENMLEFLDKNDLAAHPLMPVAANTNANTTAPATAPEEQQPPVQVQLAKK